MQKVLAASSLLLALASAAPASALPWGQPNSAYNANSSAGQQIFTFPLENGFPNIQIPSAALTAIEQQAHGTLPNGALPKSLANTSTTIFQAVAYGEIFEVAYFTALINNITNNVPGFEIGSDAVREAILDALIVVQAQEELHAIGINGILQSAGEKPMGACQYKFPVDNFDDAIAQISTFTDILALGGLQDALAAFSADGDGEVIPLLVSVAAQEGEQNGFYRSLQSLVPSALPFLTRSTGVFGFNYMMQNFVVPGSCPVKLDLPVFSPLYLETQSVQANDQQLSFSFPNNGPSGTNTQGLNLVYINQQNQPIVQPLQGVSSSGDSTTFTANFPYTTNMMNGMTIAVLVQGSGPFAGADAVTNATVYGPAVIEIN